MQHHNTPFFGTWYGVYGLLDRGLSFATAGHHPARMVRPPPYPLPPVTGNSSIGIVADRAMAATRVSMPPSGVRCLCDDRVFEMVDRDDRRWGLDKIPALLAECAGPVGPHHLCRQVRSAARRGPLKDDLSAVP